MPRSKVKELAKLTGQKRYFTGSPCPAGHVCERWTCNGQCVECSRVRVKLSSRIYKQRHPDRIRKWRRANRGLLNSLTAKRRASQKRATPTWVNVQQLKTIYVNCPIGHVVDHIIPLTHDKVCGLHVPWNLQYLTPSENSAKSNKF